MRWLPSRGFDRTAPDARLVAPPWCSPTRISLYTGRNPGRLAAGLEEPLRTRADGNGIPAGHPTLPSILRDAGYDTAMYGKWHCGWLPWYSPAAHRLQ